MRHVSAKISPSRATRRELRRIAADRTVGSALKQIYRKLDVPSRTELARMLVARD